MARPEEQIVVVRGSGDVGSAVAHRLFRAGHPVIVHDGPLPAAPRRGMAFTDAIFDGSCTLADLQAWRVDCLAGLDEALAAHRGVLIVVGELEQLLAAVSAPPAVLIDARMRKRAVPERQLGLAPLTIGLGPNFIAGETTDLVIETSWGERLGTVLASGAGAPLAGEPRTYGGHARDRFIYAPAAGTFRTACRIAEPVEVGQMVASLNNQDLVAPLSGILRGLTRDGVPVEKGTKCVEVDPRGDIANVIGIGERPARIAEGVLQAIGTGRRP
jgi:xanthine dehydrogenase accessory factor